MKRTATSRKSRTNWRRIDAMRDRDIVLSDIPEINPTMFAQAIVRNGLKPVPPKTQLTLRVDADVLAWFRQRGKGYQTRMTEILKAYKEAHERQHPRVRAS